MRGRSFIEPRFWVKYQDFNSGQGGTISFISAENLGLWLFKNYKEIKILDMWED